MVQNSKFFPWRDLFAAEFAGSGPESVLPGFFTHFGRHTAENYVSVFWTSVRVFDAFDRRATKSCGSVVSTVLRPGVNLKRRD